jgi:hypothetical protein
MKVLKDYMGEKLDALYAKTRDDLSTSINIAFAPLKEIEGRVKKLEENTSQNRVEIKEHKVSVDTVSSTLSAIQKKLAQKGTSMI